MDDLISRQAVEEWLEKWEGYIDQDTIARMQYRVIDIPSAQPEIIRCKDCKWWSNDEYRECSNPNNSDFNGYVTPKGFYCAFAERRTDG